MKEQSLPLRPVLLGGGVNAYSMARAFHEAYGVRSMIFTGSALELELRASKILLPRYVEGLERRPIFLQTLKSLFVESPMEKLILIGCTDIYADLISEHKEILEEMFVVPSAHRDVQNKIVQKDSLYFELCGKHGLAYPQTIAYRPTAHGVSDLPFGFPVVLRPADPIQYSRIHFDGKSTLAVLDNRSALNILLKQISGSGYQGNMLIQEYIPGRDSARYDLQIYIGSDHKARWIDLGRVLLEEHMEDSTRHCAAVLPAFDLVLMDKVKHLLEGIGFEGFASCNLKYDMRDQTYKLLSIRPYHGERIYHATSGEHNPAVCLVNDYTEGQLDKVTYLQETSFWHTAPISCLDHSPNAGECIEQIRQLTKAENVCQPLTYPKDMGIARRLFLWRRDLQQRRRFRLYAKNDSRSSAVEEAKLAMFYQLNEVIRNGD